jgi:hypothetical protein
LGLLPEMMWGIKATLSYPLVNSDSSPHRLQRKAGSRVFRRADFMDRIGPLYDQGSGFDQRANTPFTR